jgi:AcrR family transcriptional regulator
VADGSPRQTKAFEEMGAMAQPTSGTADRTGRPRDPDISRRCLDAARELYAAGGSSAVTFESVSRQAGVGRPAVYRRWDSAEQLLVTALENFEFGIEIHEFGDVRSELVAFTRGLMDYFASSDGAVVLRLMIEIHQQSPLRRVLGNIAAEKTLHTAEGIIQRGIDRGELRAGVSATMLTGMLSGAALYESMARRQGLSLSTPGDDYAADLVDFVLSHAKPGPV